MLTHSVTEVFPNTDVNMKSLNVIGFDYDFTLVHYTDDIHYFIYRTARDYMIDHMRYIQLIPSKSIDILKNFVILTTILILPFVVWSLMPNEDSS